MLHVIYSAKYKNQNQIENISAFRNFLLCSCKSLVRSNAMRNRRYITVLSVNALLCISRVKYRSGDALTDEKTFSRRSSLFEILFPIYLFCPTPFRAYIPRREGSIPDCVSALRCEALLLIYYYLRCILQKYHTQRMTERNKPYVGLFLFVRKLEEDP